MSLLQRIAGNAAPLDPEVVRAQYDQLFLDSEEVQLAYSLFRDVVILTDFRYIEIDVQGLRGKKIQYFSLPYKSIAAFAVESAGTFDLDAELKIWASGVSALTKDASSAGCAVLRRFSSGVDVYLVERVLAHHVCRLSAAPAAPAAGSAEDSSEVRH